MSERIRNRHLRTNGPDGTYAYRGVFPHLGGRVARNVSERIVLFKFCCFFTEGLHRTCRNVCLWGHVFTFERKGCTERVGTYHFVINSVKMQGERVRNVYGTCQNVNRICVSFFVKVFGTDPYILKMPLGPSGLSLQNPPLLLD